MNQVKEFIKKFNEETVDYWAESTDDGDIAIYEEGYTGNNHRLRVWWMNKFNLETETEFETARSVDDAVEVALDLLK